MPTQVLVNQKLLESLKIDLTNQIDFLLEKHYNSSNNYCNLNNMDAVSKEFRENSYIKLSKFVPPVIETAIRGEVYNLLNKWGVRKEMYVKETDGTPRFLNVVRQADIAREGRIIPFLYYSSVFKSFISKVIGENVLFCPYDQEKFVISRMDKPGDTHGWHWDDYSYSLIWFMECPPPELGGSLEFIPNTKWNKSNPRVEQFLQNHPVQIRHHVAGEAYLLKADTSMHRVTPLKDNAVRVMLAYTWASPNDLQKNITHETMENLYVL
ncbi:ArpA protein [Mastigocladus laminosus UU774]|nr:ArpA protein [Mastigocladus laminosus UU774]